MWTLALATLVVFLAAMLREQNNDLSGQLNVAGSLAAAG